MANVVIHPKVADALRRDMPVVALESAVITTGLPREPITEPPPGADEFWRTDQPLNLEAARQMRRCISAESAVPAVIAMIDGALHIGLDDSQLAELAADENAGKVSAGTLAYAGVTGATAGTTVSATIAAMCLAPEAGGDLAPIRFFATGGIGGVHRNWTQRPDISLDLRQLAASPVCVVSAGAKSLLDLPATVEVLETLGVPLVGFQTDHFPQFYTRGDESLGVPMRFDDPAHLADLCHLHWAHPSTRTGVLVANPIPVEADLDRLMPKSELDLHIAEAERAASQANKTGSMRTPFVLTELSKRTGGAVLRANVALLAANATLAARIAVNYAKRD